MASKSRPGVVIYFEFAHAMAQLDDADAGRLIKGLMEYAEHGVAPEFDSVLAFAWAMIKPRIDADAEHYAEICEKNAARARKRWERLNTDECQRIPEYAADANSTPTTAPTTALTTTPTTTPTEKVNMGAKRPKFTPPTLEEVEKYKVEVCSPVDPQDFLDFYEAKGWTVGSAKMKDWKAAFRRAANWERYKQKPGGFDITDPAPYEGGISL